jgi:hypothetical protein
MISCVVVGAVTPDIVPPKLGYVVLFGVKV